MILVEFGTMYVVYVKKYYRNLSKEKFLVMIQKVQAYFKNILWKKKERKERKIFCWQGKRTSMKTSDVEKILKKDVTHNMWTYSKIRWESVNIFSMKHWMNKESQPVILLHNNTYLHTINAMQQLIIKLGWEVFLHALYSLSLSPLDWTVI